MSSAISDASVRKGKLFANSSCKANTACHYIGGGSNRGGCAGGRRAVAAGRGSDGGGRGSGGSGRWQRWPWWHVMRRYN